MGLEDTESLGAVRGGQFGFQVVILYFQLSVFVLQFVVLTAHVQQDEIVFDESPGVMPDQLQALLHRRYRGDSPDADERDILVAFYLIRNQQQLRHNHDQQDREIAVSAEEKIHNTKILA